MATFYTGVDQERYDAGEKFLPQNRFLLDYTTPTTNVEEEEVTTSYGIPNTNAFINSGGGGGGGGGYFAPYTAQTLGMGPYEPGHWSYRTNRGSSVDGGYLPGAEPEEDYMSMIGGLVKKGIGMAIPGGNFLMGMAENFSRDNRLNAQDNAFIDRQLGIQEKNMHGIGNLTNQDRYGYNKVSLLGNYADKVKERVEIANRKEAEWKEANPDKDIKEYYENDIRDIDAYYLEKEKELEETNKIIEYNDMVRQKSIADKIRAGAFKTADGKDIYDGANIHGDGAASITNTDQSGSGDGGSGNNKFAGDSGNKAGTTGSWSPGGTYSAPEKSGYQQSKGSHHYADGGRIYLNLGGLASILGREGLAPGGPAGGASAGGNYGGNVNPEQEYAGRTFEERYGGGDNQNNTTVVPETNYIDVKPDLVRKDPYVNLSVMSPLEIAKLQATLGYRNIFDNDDLSVEGDLTTNIGPVNTNTKFTEDGIGNTNINWGNFSTTIDPNKNIQNIGYNNSYNGINYGVNYADGNTMFKCRHYV